MKNLINAEKENKNQDEVAKKAENEKKSPKEVIAKKGKNKRKKEAEKTKKLKKSSFLFFLGGIIGIINGFFGGGGGMVCVPVLENILKYPEKEAHATAISIIFPLSLLSAIVYVFNGKVQSLPLCLVGGGVIIGGIIGSFLLKILPPKVVAIVFSILMIFAGVRMII